MKIDNNAGALLARFAKAGMDPGVVSVAIGDPGRPIPKVLLEGMQESLKAGLLPYTPAAGLGHLRDYFADRLSGQGLISRAASTIVSAGATPLLAAAFQSLISPGDQVLVVSPYYPKFIDGIKRAGGVPVIISFDEWLVALETRQLAGGCYDRVVGIVHNSPVNPTGYVYSDEQIGALAELATARNWWVVSDETYHALNYTNEARFSVGSLFPDGTVTVRSCSKEWSMPGARLGYATGPEAIIAAMAGYLTDQVGCPNENVQRAVLWAIDQGRGEELEAFTLNLRRDLDQNRQLVLTLASQAKFEVAPMMGAFYAWVDVAHGRPGARWQGSERFASSLLERRRVAVIPGATFGVASGRDNYVRISYAAPHDSLRRAFEAMKKEMSADH